MVLSREVMRETIVHGLIFKRRADGAVEVWSQSEVYAQKQGSTTFEPVRKALAIIPANEWASLVSTMSDQGENGHSFRMALAFHTGSAYDQEAFKYEAGGVQGT